MRKRQLFLIAILAFYVSQTASAETEFNFDRPGLTRQWSAQGKIKVQRGRPQQAYSADAAEGTDFPKQDAVYLTASAESAFYTKANAVPRDWTRFEEASFWVHRNADQKEPTEVEFQVFETDTRIRFWRKITFDHTGWKRYSVPLRWMRRSPGRIPEWKQISRLGIYFRNPGSLWVDSIRLHDKSDELGTSLTAEDLNQIAFPDGTADTIAESDGIRLISSVSALDRQQLFEHLSKVREELKEGFAANKNSPVVTLIVCDDKESYHRLTQDFVAALNSKRTPPTSGGLTLHGVAFSYWSPQHGTLRPVYTHEFVHGWMMNELQIANSGEWVHEGIATYYQLKFHPQENISDMILQGIENRRLSDPLEKLCNGERIKTIRYWQAMTVVEMLMKSEKYRGRWPVLLENMRRSGSTDLEPHLAAVLQTNWNSLTDDWREFCRENYGK